MMDRLGILSLDFAVLSLLSVGGASSVLPEMHRSLVEVQGWMTSREFADLYSLAQASPGPNILFVAVMGYQAAGLPGVLATMVGIMLPSTTLALAAARWGNTRSEWRSVRAFKAGMAPIVIGLLFATSWILGAQTPGWHHVIVSIATALLVWRTRAHLLLLVSAGAVLGATGWV